MARLVFGGGTSHTPMLHCSLEHWARFTERDGPRRHIDLAGRSVSYEELLAAADPEIARRYINPRSLAERHAQTRAGLARLKHAIAAARLDALVVIGDDQHELFHADNQPAFALYWGKAIRNHPRPLLKPTDPLWFSEAQRDNAEPERARDYPVAEALARHIIERAVAAEFDIASIAELLPHQGEGHAIAFVHRHLLGAAPVPVVPVFINTYYPPNQPSAARCYKLGQVIAAAIASFDANLRVGVLASGGLSHFTVDEALDRGLLAAMEKGDAAALCAIPAEKLRQGSSEIRNWICAAGALAGHPLAWADYIPGYRTPAGTGIGICFAEWAAA